MCELGALNQQAAFYEIQQEATWEMERGEDCGSSLHLSLTSAR